MSTFASIFVFMGIGLLTGFLGGLFGIGGGMIAVPALLLTFSMMNFPEHDIMQITIGTSLAAMIFTAASSAFAHYKQNGIRWDLFKILAPGVALGSFLGAFIAHDLLSHQLKLLFGIFVIIAGLYSILNSRDANDESQEAPQYFPIFSLAIVIGTLSAILGLGGGVMIVPLLTHFGSSLRNAISTSAITGFLVALIGSLSFLTLGLNHNGTEGSVGYIYIPAFIFMGIAAALVAPIGASYSYRLSSDFLKYSFGTFQILVGLSMIIF